MNAARVTTLQAILQFAQPADPLASVKAVHPSFFVGDRLSVMERSPNVMLWSGLRSSVVERSPGRSTLATAGLRFPHFVVREKRGDLQSFEWHGRETVPQQRPYTTKSRAVRRPLCNKIAPASGASRYPSSASLLAVAISASRPSFRACHCSHEYNTSRACEPLYSPTMPSSAM